MQVIVYELLNLIIKFTIFVITRNYFQIANYIVYLNEYLLISLGIEYLWIEFPFDKFIILLLLDDLGVTYSTLVRSMFFITYCNKS